MKKDRYITIAIFSVITLLIISAIILNLNKLNNLKDDGIILQARIVKIILLTRGSPIFGYTFYYQGKEFHKENSTGVKKLNFFIGKTFPVIFSPKTENSALLISPKDFKRFNITFPDSLKWVLPYQNN